MRVHAISLNRGDLSRLERQAFGDAPKAPVSDAAGKLLLSGAA